MTKLEYAKLINWNGTASRAIYLNENIEFEIGKTINPGLSWTDGGVFNIESQGEFMVIFEIVSTVDGHEVDYQNEIECEVLGALDCEHEKEILIDKNFRIVDFWAYDEETKCARVFLRYEEIS